MSEVVRWETDDQIGIITVNRPEQLNALDESTLRALLEVLESGAASGEIRAVIVTGAGDRAFVAGADLGSMKDMNRTEAQNWSLLGQTVFSAIEDLPKPVIAAVNGFALGGGLELALACDIRVVAENAKVGLPEVTLGIFPGYAGTQRLPRLISTGKAKELIFTGAMIDAAEAHRIGIADHLTGPGEALDTARKLASQILKVGPVAVRMAKEAVNKGLDQTLEEGQKTEASFFGELCDTADQKEGAKAFLEKRPPQFKGK